jgi:hypothetical protein
MMVKPYRIFEPILQLFFRESKRFHPEIELFFHSQPGNRRVCL